MHKSEIRDAMRIDWDVPIVMDDGLTLRADVYRPVAEGRYPAIVSYGPYGKGLSFQEGYKTAWDLMARNYPDALEGSSNKYQNWEVADPEKWVPDGYACVRVDSRGAGRSPGYLDHNGARENRDFYLCIEWAAAQPWCSGKVGLNGISYYASSQWRAAALQPPHLAAICVWEGWADYYRDGSRHGGIACTFRKNWQEMQVVTVQHGRGEKGPKSSVTGELVCGPETLSDEELQRNRADMWGGVLAHRYAGDEYYRERTADLSKITVPLLSAANWGGQGLHTRGNFEGYARAASTQKWLEVHGGSHWAPFYTDYGVALQKRFFDHFLKGAGNGWDTEPRVRLQVRRVDRFVERHENEWPLERTRWTRYYLDLAERTLLTQQSRATHKVEYEALGEGLTFSTPPLKQETEITGPSALKLFLSSSTADADVFAVLRVLDPQGREVVFQGALDPHTPVGQGWLRASHRKLDPESSLPYRPYHTHDEAQPLTPGQPVELDLEIWPTCIVVPAGYRIALTLRGKDYEYDGPGATLSNMKNVMRGCGPFVHDDPTDRPAEIFGGTVSLHSSGEQQPYVLLPVIPKTRES